MTSETNITNIYNTSYSRHILLIVKKGGEKKYIKCWISTYKNNELLIEAEWVDKRKNWFPQADIDIVIKFNFLNINQDLLALMLLIQAIKKYRPNSINLIMPYFPYIAKSIYIEEKYDKTYLSSDMWFLSILEASWITSIKTLDIWNQNILDYGNLFIDNHDKTDIFTNEFVFFERTKKDIIIFTLNYEDYEFIKNKFKNKENIHVMYINDDIKNMSKNEKIDILSNVKNYSDWQKPVIYIFDKIILRWTKLYNLSDFLLSNIDLKELNICITHWIFAHWVYKKYNALLDKYPSLSIVTTNSIDWYYKKLYQDRISVYKMNWIFKINDDWNSSNELHD
jgi:phosphoribosylpyrophosphate synthetase